MSSLFDGARFLIEVWDRKARGERLKRENLSEVLHSIATLLEISCEKFQKWQVPTVEGNQIALLFTYSAEIADDFDKDEDKELADIFKEKLPKVGEQMDAIDVLIKESDGTYTLSSTEDTLIPDHHKQTVHEACVEMQRAAALIEVSAMKFKHLSKG